MKVSLRVEDFFPELVDEKSNYHIQIVKYLRSI